MKAGKVSIVRGVNGSITVMMALVLFMVTSMQLVILEHAYIRAGRTLVFQTFNKALESTIGAYYAPLFTQYGLFAMAVGEGMSFEDVSEIEATVVEVINRSLGDNGSKTPGTFMGVTVGGCATDVRTSFTDNKDIFIEQVREASVYELVYELSDTIASLRGQDLSNIEEVLTGAKDSIEDALDVEEEDETGETDAQDAYDTLVSFLQDGFSGWWFPDASNLSEREIDVFSLPTGEHFGENIVTELFEEPEFDELAFDDGDYLDELVSDSITNGFQEALLEGLEEGGNKLVLAGYSVAKMDNYIKDEVDGKLKYEQEYLIFGSESDEANVKKASWSIFGIRLIANLLYLMADEDAWSDIQEWVGAITGIASWITLLSVIVAVVLAVENAIVETAAILKGKSVDFAVCKETQMVKLTEIFSFTKDSIMNKAEAYKGVSSIKLSYQMYLYIFMFMVNESVLAYRMMDVIELNMKRLYDSDFKMDKCIVGFSATVSCTIPEMFLGLMLYQGPERSSDYVYRFQSAIMY